LVNIPNALTLARIILVPLIVWLIITHEMATAFVLFLLAGLSDGADGYLAKRFGWHTELGAYLDPDILIIGAFILSWMLSRPVTIYPLLVSKANTLAQLVLASLVLAKLGLGLKLEPLVAMCIWVTGALTILSATVYLWVWLRHMASYEPQPAPLPARKSHRKPIKTGAGSRVRTS
jgi:cardiolipin synthase